MQLSFLPNVDTQESDGDFGRNQNFHKGIWIYGTEVYYPAPFIPESLSYSRYLRSAKSGLRFPKLVEYVLSENWIDWIYSTSISSLVSLL